jgi:tetratricopeptide (TPR) repeat protein
MSLMDQFSQLTQVQRVQGIKSGAFSLKRVMNVVSQENDRIRKEYFTKNRFAEAQQEYSKIVGFVKKIPLLDEGTENYVKSVTHKFFNNMGICALKRSRYKGAQDLMEKAIETSSGDKKLLCKSYFIMGKSHRMRNYFKTAKDFYEKALKLDPYNQDIQQEFLLLDQDKKQKSREDRTFWGGAFEKSFEKCEKSENSDSEVSTLVGSVNSKPKSQNLDKNNNVVEDHPKAFLGFVENFMVGFKNAKAQRQRVPEDRLYSRKEMLYIANQAEEYGFDANMEVDEDANQHLVIKKLEKY